MNEKKRERGILVKNIHQLSQEGWLNMRKNGIGGSDASAILGVSPFTTRKELFWKKMNVPDSAVTEKTEYSLAKDLGHVLEPVLVRLFLAKNPGWKVYFTRAMYYHPDYPFMIADIDAIAVHDGKEYILELKTGSEYTIEKWGERFSNEIPVEYIAQGMHYMSVMDMDGVIFVYLAGNNEANYRQRFLKRDLDAEMQLINAEKDFWINYVQKGIEPPFNGADTENIMGTLKRHYKPKGTVKKIPEEFLPDLEKLDEIDGQIRLLNQQVKKLKGQKDLLMGNLVNYLKGEDGRLQTTDAIYEVCSVKRKQVQIPSDSLEILLQQQPQVKPFLKTKESFSWKMKKTKYTKEEKL